MCNWLVEVYRFTGFWENREGKLLERAEELWNSIGGAEFEDFTLRREKQSVVYSVGIDEEELSLSVSGNGRFDLRVTPNLQNPANDRAGIPSVGAFPDGMESLIGRASQLIDSFPALKRIAFGVTLNILADDVPGAYAKFRELVPSVSPPDDGVDFLYRINKRMSSKVSPELHLNRVLTWSTSQYLKMGVTDRSQAIREIRTVLGLEMDLNTFPGFPLSDLGKTGIQQVFAELSSQSLSIVKEGTF